MKSYEIYVDEENLDRLDFFVSQEIDEVSRTFVQRLIKDGNVLVNGKVKKPSYSPKEGDYILVNLPEPRKLELLPEDIPLDIVFEDENLAIINKPQDMVVHPAPGNYEHTLVNALLFHLDNLSSINGIIRPGIVHRLDKDTSGLLVVAKTDFAHRFLSDQLKTHKVYREYIALIHGVLKTDEGTINQPIGRDKRDRKRMAVTHDNSKEAITHYKVLMRFEKYTLVAVKLETGRTHQIRVHFSFLKHPVVGDPVYSNLNTEFKLEKQLLHARKLGFIHPIDNQKVEFQCDLPEYFQTVLKKLDGRDDFDYKSCLNGSKSNI